MWLLITVGYTSGKIFFLRFKVRGAVIYAMVGYVRVIRVHVTRQSHDYFRQLAVSSKAHSNISVAPGSCFQTFVLSRNSSKLTWSALINKP